MANHVDPGDYLYSRDGKHIVVLHDNAHARTLHIVGRVYDLVKGMGGDEDDHSSFLQKICENDTYFAEWCRDLPKWCPSEATYVKVVDEEEQEGEDGEEDES